ncbi:MAG: septum formation protein Maf [Clostridia bacterium]|nr:septum formation protein Maf [Clostridia bacterium]
MQYHDLKLILASQSPRRRQLIADLNLPFECISTNSDESTAETKPDMTAIDISRKKALWAFDNKQINDNEVIIGADTIVVFNDRILGKPKSDDDARKMLNLLSGKTHSVYTGVTFIWKSSTPPKQSDCRDNIISYITVSQDSFVCIKSFAEKTGVTFRQITAEEIEAYIDTKDHKDKAGSYGIQGPFSLHIPAICGDYNNVVGFPLARIYKELKAICAF